MLKIKNDFNSKKQIMITITCIAISLGLFINNTTINNTNQNQDLISIEEHISYDVMMSDDSNQELEIATKIEAEAEAETETETLQQIVTQSNPTTCTAEELDILYRIVQCEAGGEDEIGKILIVNVIINRVNSEKFPNTIKEVVFSPKQFSPVGTSTYDNAVVSEATIIAVNKAINLGEDYSLGALYFNTPDVTNNKTVLLVHGGHIFYA